MPDLVKSKVDTERTTSRARQVKPRTRSGLTDRSRIHDVVRPIQVIGGTRSGACRKGGSGKREPPGLSHAKRGDRASANFHLNGLYNCLYTILKLLVLCVRYTENCVSYHTHWPVGQSGIKVAVLVAVTVRTPGVRVEECLLDLTLIEWGTSFPSKSPSPCRKSPSSYGCAPPGGFEVRPMGA